MSTLQEPTAGVTPAEKTWFERFSQAVSDYLVAKARKVALAFQAVRVYFRPSYEERSLDGRAIRAVRVYKDLNTFNTQEGKAKALARKEAEILRKLPDVDTFLDQLSTLKTALKTACFKITGDRDVPEGHDLNGAYELFYGKVLSAIRELRIPVLSQIREQFENGVQNNPEEALATFDARVQKAVDLRLVNPEEFQELVQEDEDLQREVFMGVTQRVIHEGRPGGNGDADLVAETVESLVQSGVVPTDQAESYGRNLRRAVLQERRDAQAKTEIAREEREAEQAAERAIEEVRLKEVEGRVKAAAAEDRKLDTTANGLVAKLAEIARLQDILAEQYDELTVSYEQKRGILEALPILENDIIGITRPELANLIENFQQLREEGQDPTVDIPTCIARLRQIDEKIAIQEEDIRDQKSEIAKEIAKFSEDVSYDSLDKSRKKEVKSIVGAVDEEQERLEEIARELTQKSLVLSVLKQDAQPIVQREEAKLEEETRKAEEALGAKLAEEAIATAKAQHERRPSLLNLWGRLPEFSAQAG